MVLLPATGVGVDVPLSSARAGRGVLDGAFCVLEALCAADRGLGLTELARTSGLAKTSAYRLAEQLTGIGAVQCVDQRYFIGPMLGHLGQCWQPNPVLRRACEEPIRKLSVMARATAGVYVLHRQQARLVTATTPPGHSWIPPREFDAETTPHTAVGRALLAAQPHSERPPCIPPAIWQRWRSQARDPRFVITESDQTPAGCSIAAVPIWGSDGECVGTAAVLPHAPAPSSAIINLLLHTTRRIGQVLRLQQERSAG